MIMKVLNKVREVCKVDFVISKVFGVFHVVNIDVLNILKEG